MTKEAPGISSVIDRVSAVKRFYQLGVQVYKYYIVPTYPILSAFFHLMSMRIFGGDLKNPKICCDFGYDFDFDSDLVFGHWIQYQCKDICWTFQGCRNNYILYRTVYVQTQSYKIKCLYLSLSLLVDLGEFSELFLQM